MDDLDLDNPDPRWQQIADILREHINTGQIPPGAKLPTHNQIRDRYRVSLGTVKRAYATLQARGLIVTRQGQGAYVRTTPASSPPPLGDQVAELRRDLNALHERMSRLEQAILDTPPTAP